MEINLTDIIIAFMTAVLAPAIMLLVSQGADYLKSKKKNELYSKYIDIASNIITDVMNEVNGTMVKELKKGGVFDKAKQIEVLNIAKMQVKNSLSEQALSVLNEVVSDVDKWIQIKLESEIEKNKG